MATNPPTVIPTLPTDFKRRNVGVRLVVKPQITADNKTVDLSLFPEVTDFEGFINYGSPIFVANPDGTQSLLSNNEINQPVFNTRRINTKVLVHDGSTVVLGGLIRDDIQNINDKVPILGDIPLLGRLFQSKAVENTKRNLIIFVSADIYRNDGELLNQPEVTNTADILTGTRRICAAPPRLKRGWTAPDFALFLPLGWSNQRVVAEFIPCKTADLLNFVLTFRPDA